MGVKAVVVLAGLSACFPEPREPRNEELIHQIPAPEALQAKPLTPGQWSVYEERVGGKTVGLARFGVVGVDACGTWVQVDVGPPLRSWQLCIDAEQRIAVAKLHGEPVNLREYAGELEALRTRIVPPALAGTFTRADVTVPAGHFQQTLRVANGATWLHPDVPLGAAVQIEGADGRTDVLVAYSDQPATAVPRNVLKPPASRRLPLFLEMRFGNGWLSGVPHDQANQFEVSDVVWGLVLSPTRDFILDAAFGDNRRFSTSDDTASKLWLVAVGERWSPFRTYPGPHGAFAREGLYVDISLGYTRLDRGMDGVGNGFAAVTGLGWEILRARDWALALHASYDVGFLDGNVGVRQAVSAGGAIQLFLP